MDIPQTSDPQKKHPIPCLYGWAVWCLLENTDCIITALHCLAYFQWNYIGLNSAVPCCCCCWVNYRWGNGMVPSDNTLWPEPMLTQVLEHHMKSPRANELTNWGRDKMAAISQTTFSNAFSSMKMFEFRLKFHWSLFPRVQWTIFQHWFR